MNQERPKIKGIAFVNLDIKAPSRVDYELSDLKSRLVYDISQGNPRPVLVTESGMWVKYTNDGGLVGYDRFGISDGYLELETGGLPRERAERLGVAQVLEKLEGVVRDYSAPLTSEREISDDEQEKLSQERMLKAIDEVKLD